MHVNIDGMSGRVTWGRRGGGQPSLTIVSFRVSNNLGWPLSNSSCPHEIYMSSVMET